MTRGIRIGAAVIAGLAAQIALSAQAPAKKPKAPNAAYQKLAEEWPDAETLEKRKQDSEKHPLFAGTDVVTLTLKADFKAINKEREENNAVRFPATFTVGADATAIPAQLGSRGHSRLKVATCGWVPLRVIFKKADVAGTLFEGQSSIKLVTHCRDNDSFEQHVLREYLPYRIYGLLSPIAFRARLAKITYADAAGKPMTTRYGMFIEDDSDVARRATMRSIDLPRTLFKDLDQAAVVTMNLFEYMIGNTDVSILKNHNVKLMVDQQRAIRPIPYDFDYSGLVDTPCANPDPKLGITSVRDRIYRGPCVTLPEFEPVLNTFRAKKADIYALYDSLPDLNPGYRKDARAYLDSFYLNIEPARVKKTLVDGCVRAPGM